MSASLPEDDDVAGRLTAAGPCLRLTAAEGQPAATAYSRGCRPLAGTLASRRCRDKAGIAFIGTSETQESDLQTLGDAAVGLETGYFYSAAHESAENKAFVAKLKQLYPKAEANPATVSAYDGTHAIYEMIKATGGKPDADKAIAAVAGKAWESPRGPISIDAKTRDIIQNVYIRKVEKGADGKLLNKEIKTFENQPDYGVAK